MACDSPTKSLIAKAAAKLQMKPPARLMTKEDHWPALVSIFLGHSKTINCVAFSAADHGKTVVSGSTDGTLRCGQQTIFSSTGM